MGEKTVVNVPITSLGRNLAAKGTKQSSLKEGEAEDTTPTLPSEQNTEGQKLYSERYSAESIRQEKPRLKKRLEAEKKRGDPGHLT